MPKYIELSSLLEKLQATSIVTDDLYCRMLKTKCPNDADFFCAYGEKESGN